MNYRVARADKQPEFTSQIRRKIEIVRELLKFLLQPTIACVPRPVEFINKRLDGEHREHDRYEACLVAANRTRR
jgi:hypothetical protein